MDAPIEIPANLTKIMGILAAIPVTAFALWADYFGRHVDRLEKDTPDFDREPELAKVQIFGLLAFVSQSLIYLGQPMARQFEPWLAVGLFATGLFLQSRIQGGLERRLRKTGAADPGTGIVGWRSWLWLAISVAAYLSVFYASIAASFTLAHLLHMPKGMMIAMLICGGVFGILAGLAMTFALAPLHVRKTVPTTELKDDDALGVVRDCFARAKLRLPSVWVIEMEGLRWNNAMVAGFTSGRGWFRPALFITRSVLKGCSPEELRAILLHEVSHLALHHLRNRLIYSFGTIIAASALSGMLLAVGQHVLPQNWMGLIALVAVLLPIVVPFAMVMKLINRQELEADLYAITDLGGSLEPFAEALRKLDSLNHPELTPARASLSHPETEYRLLILRKLVAARASRQQGGEAEPRDDQSKAA